MKTNKRRIFGTKTPHFVITTIVASILVLLFGIWIWGKSTSLTTKLFNQPTVTNTTTKGTVYYVDDPELPYIYKQKEDGTIADDFKVMVLADTHFWDLNQEFTLNVLDNFLKHENPDLVVFIGDVLFRVQDYKWQQKLNNFFEERNQYWTFCLGNHDSEGWSFYQHKPMGESRQTAFKSLNGQLINSDGKPSKHCLARSYFNTDNTYGNHFINIKGSDNKTLETLFLFDYRDYQFKNDGLVNWYKTSLDKITTDNGGVTPKSVAFGHVPMYEAKYAYDNIGKDPDVKYISGANTEGIRMPHVNSGLFDAFVERGSTDRMMFGHYHINNLCASYKGVSLCFTSGLAYNCYTLRNCFHWSPIFGITHMLDDSISLFNDGVTNLLVQKNNDTQMQHVFAQNTDWAFKGLEKDLFFMTNMLVTYNAQWCTIVNRICLPITAGAVISYYTLFAIYHIKRKRGK